jgi:hypothetical protein
MTPIKMDRTKAKLRGKEQRQNRRGRAFVGVHGIDDVVCL